MNEEIHAIPVLKASCDCPAGLATSAQSSFTDPLYFIFGRYAPVLPGQIRGLPHPAWEKSRE
jgi:hypothetical protein